MPNPIDEPALKALLQKKPIAASLIGRDEGFYLVLSEGRKQYQLMTQRGQLRTFRGIAGASRFLTGIGITQFSVDTNGIPVARPRSARPDASSRLRQAHEDAAFSAELRRLVKEADDDPRPSRPHDDVMRRLDELIES